MEAQLQLIQKHIDDRFNRIEKLISDVATQGADNNKDLVRFEERLKSGAENFCRNNEQHKEFYTDIDKLESRADRIDGGLRIINIIIISLALPLIVLLVRSFL